MTDNFTYQVEAERVLHTEWLNVPTIVLELVCQHKHDPEINNVLDSGRMRGNDFGSGFNQMSMQGPMSGGGGMPFFGGGSGGGSRGGWL